MTKMKNVAMVCRDLLKLSKYRVAVLGISLVFALLQIWLTSYSLIIFVYRSDAFSWRDRVSILWSAITLFFGDLTLTAQVFTFLTAFLIGLNITLLIFYFRKRLAERPPTGASVLGMLASLLGVGCTSCGSVVLSSMVGFTATAKLLAVLPLRGKEFSLFAMGALLVSIYLLAQKIANPLCKIPLGGGRLLKKFNNTL